MKAFARSLILARSRHDTPFEVRSLIMLGVGETSSFRYRAALRFFQEAEKLAAQAEYPLLAGLVSGNISTVYSQVGDWVSAESEAARSISYFRRVQNQDDYVRVRLARALQSHAYLCFQVQRNMEGYKDSKEAISLAEATGDYALQSLILDISGSALLKEGKIPEASAELNKALALSSQHNDQEGLPFIKEHLAELEIRKRNPDWILALQLIDAARSSGSHSFGMQPRYLLIHYRAKILLGSGNKMAALVEFKRAVEAADEWRIGALPGDTTSTQTVATLQEVYADYAQLAAGIALQRNDNVLAVNALEVLAGNRAASLREQLRLVYGSNWKLPDEYFSKLSELQVAQAKVVFGSSPGDDNVELKRIRQDISELENQIGIKPEKSIRVKERIHRRNSLRDIQRTLSGDQVLISITLGKSQSYLWAVTREGVHLSRIPAESEVQHKAAAFAAAVQADQNSIASGDALSRALFAGLPADVWNRSEWMLVADGPLLTGIPFAAMTNGGVPNSGQSGIRLIQGKSLRLLPSELLLLDNQAERLRTNFVGVGDPIYNLADARLKRGGLADAKSISGRLTLARLVGSEKEIRAAANESHSGGAVFLTGANATREKVVSALAGDTNILHFAVHVVSPPDQPQQAALALSLKNGIPELMTPEVVASLHAPGSLVVLSGCSSGQGKVIPGAGLMGLSRAWLLAGAAAVVVSNWPTPDGSGRFFSSFYGHFDQIRTGSTGQRAALALRRTQLDMLNGKGYQASPAFWGAFAVISKE